MQSAINTRAHTPNGSRPSRHDASHWLPMLPDLAKRWVCDVLGPGSRLVSARHLSLGGWHVNHMVEVLDGRGCEQRLVLRRWARPGWQVADPDYTVARETQVLELLAPTAVPAPAVVATDPDGAHCDVPAMLLTCLPGHPPDRADSANIEDFCGQLAETLADIHCLDVDTDAELWPYRLYHDRANARPAHWMPRSPVWERATAVVREPAPSTGITVIHRDYHPQNTLWQSGRLTGVVDWTQAGWGPPGFDIGHMRWNLVADYGQHAADHFLACYQSITGNIPTDQPYWDLVALFDLLLADDPSDITPSAMRCFEDYARTVLTRRQ